MVKDILSAKPCPNCRAMIHRRNFRSVITKCKRCYKMICPQCAADGLCHDCYIVEYANAESVTYFSEKLGKVARDAV